MFTAWDDDTGVVELPSGLRLRGRSLAREAAPADYTLVLATGFRPPPWAHRVVAWRDFRAPTDTPDAIDAIREAYRRARDGERVEAACRGGVGRTGTALAALAMLDGLDRRAAIAWARRAYHPRAVETPWQARWLRHLEATD